MKQISIYNPFAQRALKVYLKLLTDKGYKTDFEEAVNSFKSTCREQDDNKVNDIYNYLVEIVNRFDNLISLKPSDTPNIIEIFKTLPGNKYLDNKITFKNSRSVRLHKWIVDKMGYDKMKKETYPIVAKEFKDVVKTCVYCNANYVITDRNNNTYYDLDHYRPKSRYPYLCLSLFNMQPSCPSCNRHKGKIDNTNFFHLWQDNSNNKSYSFTFRLEPASIINYILQGKNCKTLKIEILDDSNNGETLSLVNNIFHLSDRYQEHSDEAEEILWKRRVYSQGFIEAFRKQFSSALVNFNVNRFILGNYSKPDEIHKRPLAKMTRDIANQLGLITK